MIMEYIDFKKLIDVLAAKPKETEWVEFKHNFHSKEEIGERISALSNSAYLCSMPFGYIVLIFTLSGRRSVMRYWSPGYQSISPIGRDDHITGM